MLVVSCHNFLFNTYDPGIRLYFKQAVSNGGDGNLVVDGNLSDRGFKPGVALGVFLFWS